MESRYRKAVTLTATAPSLHPLLDLLLPCLAWMLPPERSCLADQEGISSWYWQVLSRAVQEMPMSRQSSRVCTDQQGATQGCRQLPRLAVQEAPESRRQAKQVHQAVLLTRCATSCRRRPSPGAWPCSSARTSWPRTRKAEADGEAAALAARHFAEGCDPLRQKQVRVLIRPGMVALHLHALAGAVYVEGG